MADPITVGLAVGGTVASIVGGFSAARKRRRLAEAIARQKEAEAREVGRRNQTEIAILQNQLQQNIGEQVASFAGSGIDVGSGASVQAQMASFENFGRTVLNKNLETRFRQRQLMFEGKQSLAEGRDAQGAAVVNAFGSLIEGGVALNEAGVFKRSNSTGKTIFTGGDSGVDMSRKT
jgi:hydrogenase maturation factor HypF (carbamoyltransferase family)